MVKLRQIFAIFLWYVMACSVTSLFSGQLVIHLHSHRLESPLVASFLPLTLSIWPWE